MLALESNFGSLIRVPVVSESCALTLPFCFEVLFCEILEIWESKCTKNKHFRERFENLDKAILKIQQSFVPNKIFSFVHP